MNAISCRNKREGVVILNHFSSKGYSWNTEKEIQASKDIDLIWPKGGDLVIIELENKQITFMGSVSYQGHTIPYIKFISSV